MDRVDGYEVVGSFECGNRHMIVIKAAHGTHVMPSDEWESIKRGLSENSAGFHVKREKYKVA